MIKNHIAIIWWNMPHISFFKSCIIVQSPSRVWLFVTPMDYSTPGLPVSHHLLESAQVHVHLYSWTVWKAKIICSVQFSSVAQSCPTLRDPMNCSTLGLPVHHHLPEFTQTHIHQVGDAIQPSHPLSSPSPPAIPPSIRVFSNESTLRMTWPKY